MQQASKKYAITKRLYAITDESPFELLLEKLDAALFAGIVSMVQYRRKDTAKGDQLSEASKLLALCDHYHIPLIINDDVDLAARLGCGVHLGQDDGSIAEAKKVLQPQAIVGSTCHQSLQLALQAQHLGASYAAFGAINPSKTKPNANLVPLSVLRSASKQLTIPICAIGGISPKDILVLKKAGVSMFAVIRSLFGGQDECANSAKFMARLTKWQEVLSQLN